jgi:hypothetical protein
MNEAPQEEGEPTEMGRPGEDGEPNAEKGPNDPNPGSFPSEGDAAQSNPGIPDDGRGMDEQGEREQEDDDSTV